MATKEITLTQNLALQAILKQQRESSTRYLPKHIEFMRGHVHYYDVFGYGKYTANTHKALVERGLIEDYTADHNKHQHYIRLTPAGLAYLYQDAPMVDQPQPAPEVSAIEIGQRVNFDEFGVIYIGTVSKILIEDEWVMVDVDGGWQRRRTVDELTVVDQPQPEPVDDDYDYSAEWDAYVTQREREHFNSPEYGTDEDTVTYDDLPFSDLGVDDEDTKELPAITVDTPTPTLSNLIDVALNPDDTEAYNALKAYDWASVPLWVIEIERDDVNAYKWDIWNELRKMNGGILLSNPDAVYKGREVDRAFNVMAILNNAIYSFHKGVGFNVLD